ncbi:transmembrane protein 182-like [Centroberyx affinis]|uniref:transmembrane protein 182-like n=1 Tax=Centroberyx affinis TaxID=166261 RepID=UPI003A5BE952
MSPAGRQKVLVFLASFFGAVGFLSALLSCGTEYWLLASESCSSPGDRSVQEGGGSGLRHGKSNTKAADDVRFFHEGLFWRCSFFSRADDYSVWDFWIPNQPPSKVCQSAFLFPFPVYEPISTPVKPHSLPAQPSEPDSAIVFRTFWSIFLVAGAVAVVIGGFVVICAGPLANHNLYKVGGALQLCGGLCLLAVVLMYLMWIQVLDTLERFSLHQRVSGCPSFQLSIQHGPSFLLAPVAVFFFLLAGLLFILVGCNGHRTSTNKRSLFIKRISPSSVCKPQRQRVAVTPVPSRRGVEGRCSPQTGYWLQARTRPGVLGVWLQVESEI